jgi:hypothetical protein
MVVPHFKIRAKNSMEGRTTDRQDPTFMPVLAYTHCLLNLLSELSQICEGKGRAKTARKAHTAILISFATNTTHLEVVHKLTTAAFIKVLIRFMSGHRKCAPICSDNASNFIEAELELQDFIKLN